MPALRRCALVLIGLAATAAAQQIPTPAAAGWWHETTALANDGMEGRDTGTEAYERAAKYVAVKFAAAGLKPAGENGTFFQRVPMHQIDLDNARSEVVLADATGNETRLQFTTEATTVPREDLSLQRAPVVFLGYGMPKAGEDLHGKVVVFFNNAPSDLLTSERAAFPARRLQALAAAGAAAVLSIDNPATTEPFHWPAAYARSVTLTGEAAHTPNSPITIRVDSAVMGKLLRDGGEAILPKAIRGEPLPATADAKLFATIHLHTSSKEISSPNILAILPGSAAAEEKDSTLAPEYVALSAHLDGYGYGTPVLGDKLYNGALDDAAYVATLLELARTQAALPPSQRPKRSLLFCIFTGEEKGLLGSAYFTQHPTVPIANIVANLNLDQLRPIFPLKILTMEGIADSTLGDTARTVAAKYNIELRPDLEPERNLFRRADNYNFVRVGIPIASFIFGYDRATSEEASYRDWYARRYHKPQDDLSTPIDWNAAVTFNNFYRDLTRAVADSTARPAWLRGSPYAPTKATDRTQP